MKSHVIVSYTRNPGGNTSYELPSWWVHTENRFPDLALDGPFRTKAEAVNARRFVKGIKYVPFFGYAVDF